jgi:hypothetical protein
MADKKKPVVAAAAAPDMGLMMDMLRAQLTQRCDELLESRSESQALSQRVAQLQRALDASEKGARENAEIGSRLAKEREAYLQADLDRKEAEAVRLRESLALATERVMEVQRDSEAAIKAKVQEVATLRSRMDDITDKFNDDLLELKRRLDLKLSLLASEVDQSGGMAGHTEAGGVRVAGQAGLLAVMQKETI